MHGHMHTGFSSQIGTKLRDWAVGQAWGSCYSWAALSSNDSKTLYSPGNELLERLSSSLESALNVDTDLADPELTDPLPEMK